jgi:hypothetical protein
MSSPTDYGLDDSYFIDAYHPGEIFMGYILRDLLFTVSPGSALEQVDIEHLEKLLQTDRASRLFFEASICLNED